jgi:serpin B
MSILNTVYLKDEWVDRFDVKDTKPDTFYLENAQQKQCDFMNMSYITHQFVKGEGFTSSSLALKNAESMTFILPDKGVSVDDLLATPEKVASLFNTQNSVNGKVIFQIPKFSFGSNLDLTDTLKSLGVISAFSHDADFTGITDNKAFISNIKQQTHIAIDEKGVEAAAFTQIDYAGSSPPKDKIAEMILNRPFIYGITSNNGALLFIGVCTNPTAQ